MCSSDLALFADDTQALAKGRNLSDLFKFVNSELEKLALWFMANKMKVNVSKTRFIVFSKRSINVELGNLKVLYNDNEPGGTDENLIFEIERIYSNHPDVNKRYYKSLGILLDDHLSFNAHFNSLHKKLSRSIFIMNKLKHFLPLRILKSIYYSTFHCHLTY